MSGSAATCNTPRIFVSHSHTDNAYCRAFVAALRHALGGDDETVWYDEHNLGWGNIRRTIERELEQRQHFIAILSPSAVASQWVNDEIDAALRLLQRGKMRTVSFVTAIKCDVPLLLESYKRVEVPGGEGYAPPEAAARVLHFIRPATVPPPPVPVAPPAGVTMPGKSRPAPAVPRRPVPAPAPAPVRPILPRERFPERMERLGFAVELGRDPKTGKEVTYIRPPLCPVLAGPFLMGSDPKQDKRALGNEQPQIRVEIPGFQIGKFPVTVAEYACFVVAGHATPQKGVYGMDWQTQLQLLDHPVTSVTWYDARDYAAWLARLTGQPWKWKVPNEAEWEKAARWDPKGNGGRGLARIYPWGDRFDASRCNNDKSNIGATTPVGSYGPENPSRDGSSPCGAQDMAGNVWEWTRTIRSFQPYSKYYQSYIEWQIGREDSDSTEPRVQRGASWNCDAGDARAAYRSESLSPETFSAGRGFRVVLRAAAGS